MNKISLKNKVVALEAEIKLLKRKAVGEPNFGIDNISWKRVKPALKKARTKTYNQVYG